jgi:hypothetical protein
MKYLIKESQYVYLLENLEKNKKFLTKLLGKDLIDTIQVITSPNNLPIGFLKHFGASTIQQYIDKNGPFYYFVLDGEPFLYKDKGDYELYLNDKGKIFDDGEITERLGLSDMGFKFSDVVNTIFDDDDEEVITESKQNNVIDKLLESFGITYNIKYGKRGLNELRQYDAVIITFYVDRGGRLEFTEMEPVYFFTKGNEIISEPFVNRDFSRILNAFEYVPEELLKNYFSDKAKIFLENYLNERSN